MLLLVMQPELDDGSKLGKVVGGCDQPRDRVIDVTTISGDFSGARTRDQAPLRARLTRPGRHVVGIVKIGEALVERPIIAGMRREQELLKKPADMSAMPFGRARLPHRLHDLVLGGEPCRAPLRFSPYAAERVKPTLLRILRGSRLGRRGAGRSMVR